MKIEHPIPTTSLEMDAIPGEVESLDNGLVEFPVGAELSPTDLIGINYPFVALFQKLAEIQAQKNSPCFDEQTLSWLVCHGDDPNPKLFLTQIKIDPTTSRLMKKTGLPSEASLDITNALQHLKDAITSGNLGVISCMTSNLNTALEIHGLGMETHEVLADLEPVVDPSVQQPKKRNNKLRNALAGGAIALSSLLSPIVGGVNAVEAATQASARASNKADCIHTVGPGQSLSGLAAWYGTTVDIIIKANNLKSANVILVGQRLTIPGSTMCKGSSSAAPPAQPGTGQKTTPSENSLAQPSIVHKKKFGQTYNTLSKIYGISPEAIAAANGNVSAAFLNDVIIPPKGQTTVIQGYEIPDQYQYACKIIKRFERWDVQVIDNKGNPVYTTSLGAGTGAGKYYYGFSAFHGSRVDKGSVVVTVAANKLFGWLTIGTYPVNCIQTGDSIYEGLKKVEIYETGSGQ